MPSNNLSYPTRITDLSNTKLRHQIRGALANSNGKARSTTIGNARRLLTPKDVSAFTKICCTTDLDKFYYGPPFPTEVRTIYRNTKKQEINLELECHLQIERMKFYFDLALPATESLSNINSKIMVGELENANSLCNRHIDEFGFSAALARKVIFLHSTAREFLETEGEDFQKEYSGPLLGRFFSVGESSLFSHYMNLLLDLCDPDNDCMQVRYEHFRVLEESNYDPDRYPLHELLIKRSLYPTFYHSIIDPIGLLYFSSSSALDLLLDFIITSHTNTRKSITISQLFNDSNFKTAKNLLQNSNSVTNSFLKSIRTTSIEQSMYRASYVFPEVSQFARWRRAIDYELYMRERGTEPQESKIFGFFPRNLRLDALCCMPIGRFRTLLRFEPNYADTFIRTTAVLNRLRNGERLSSLSSHSVRMLLAYTSGFSQILTVEELEDLRDSAASEESNVIVFLSMVMLNQKNPDEDLAFDLRMEFQDLIKDSFDSDIIQFLRWLNEKTSNLCPVIIELCDISFLERLYTMNDSFSKVLEERERICRWASIAFDNSELKAIADRIVLDAKVKSIRGEIDETRIFVDVVRYQQWAQDTIGPILKKFERVIMVSRSTEKEITGISDNRPVEKGAPTMGIDYWFDHACKLAFKEFCHNKIFGIDSYLSRRIRHGTLAGTLVVPIQEIVDSFKEKFGYSLNQNDRKALENLLYVYRNHVSHIRDDLLHFRSTEKPNGLLFPISVANDSRNNMKSEFRDQIVGLLLDKYNATSLCPLFLDFCWNLITADLIRVQKELKHYFTSSIRPQLRSIASRNRSNNDWRYLAHELDQTAEGLMDTLSSWFTKSEGTSMTVNAEELVTVVVEEVGNYVPTYGRQYNMIKGGLENLFGFTYQTVYDVLFVLFHNIAQHADSEAEAVVESEFVVLDDSKQKGFMMKVTSKNRRDVDDETVRDLIRNALTQQNTQDSMIREGNSGLNKVQAILQAVSPNSTFEWKVENGKCSITFMMPIILVGAE